ncbi:hypothetical protein [Mesorhizobium sp. WSM3876]|nr:hypothetical protein [Mesorhizobium sp. WSM3876]
MAITGENVTKRTITWQDLWKLRPDLRPANDDNQTGKKVANGTR